MKPMKMGTVISPVILIDVFYFDPGEENGYGYEYKLAGRTFVNVGGKVLPNVSGSPYNFRMTKNGKFAFKYGNYDGYWHQYVYVDGKTFGPYRYISSFSTSESGDFGFMYRQEEPGGWFYNVNGKDKASKEDFENIPSSDDDNAYFQWTHHYNGSYEHYGESIEVLSPDNQHLFFSNYAYEYVVVDGQEVGHSPALNAWYNESNRSFGWSAVEDKELVVYEYKLN